LKEKKKSQQRMMRIATAQEQEEEAKMQNFIFKINIALFVGTIVAIKAGTIYS
jgi:hypothetical protein